MADSKINNPVVSVVVPSYNYGHTIKKCVDSILAQTFTDWELIVIDDCSTDNSLEVLEQYKSDPRIEVSVNETNKGIFGNLEVCIARAKGRYIKILMADDWLHPDYLAETVPLFEKYPSISLASVRTEVYDPAGKLITTRMEPEPDRIFYPSADLLEWTAKHINPIGNPSRVIFRHDVYDEVDGFDVKIAYCTDYELWIRMLENHDAAFVPGKVLSYELLHSQNATKSYSANARHITTGEEMFVKAFQNHKFYKNKPWLQQRIWLWGFYDYWINAIRHWMSGQSQELTTLIQVLRRRAWAILWIPMFGWRFIQVLARRAFSKIQDLGASNS